MTGLFSFVIIWFKSLNRTEKKLILLISKRYVIKPATYHVVLIYLFRTLLYYLKAFYYPPNVGYNIGTEDSPNSYMLEIHYDNPEGIEGQYTHLFFFFFKNHNKRCDY